MGVDYSGQAIIGVKISDPLLVKQTRGCRHPEQNARFCSECGQPMWHSSKELNPKLDALDEYNNPHPSGLQICHSTDNEEYFVGMYMTCTGSSRSNNNITKTDLPSVLNVEEVKVKLKEYLGDLYKEKEFGLWVVLHCSY